MTRVPRLLLVAVAIARVLSTSIRVPVANATSAQVVLSSHWVPSWGFRDELNRSDIDYQNFWTDNAGKILTASIIAHNSTNADRSLWFIRSHLTTSYYLPEVVVDSSILHLGAG